MRILGIEASSRFLCIAVSQGASRVSEFRVDLGKKHSAYILPMLKRILESLKMSWLDIDYFAVGLGPGSFTGLRLSLAVTKGLAYALKKPIVGISSLDILALGVLHAAELKEMQICPIIDAKRNLIYSSLYALKDGRLKRKQPYRLITLDGLISKTPSRVVFLGDALTLYKDRIKTKRRQAILLDEDYWYPQPGNIIELAKERISANMTDSIEKIKPIYLYPKECLIRR